MLSFTPAARRRQWLGFVGSPAVWTLYFVAVYVLNEAACKLTLLGATAVLPVATVLALLTLAAVGYAGWLAYQAWREGDGAEAEDGGGNGRFLGLTGLLLSSLFALMTVAVWVAAWVLRPC